MACHIVKELREQSYIIMVIQLGSISRTNNCAHIFLSTFIDTNMGQLITLNVLGSVLTPRRPGVPSSPWETVAPCCLGTA